MNISDFSDSDGSQIDSSEEQTDKPLQSEPNEEQKKGDSPLGCRRNGFIGCSKED